MRFQHTKCGGEIDVKKRQCMRCKKKWDPVSFRLDPIGIRPMKDKKGRTLPDRVDPKSLRSKKYKTPKRPSYAGWVDKVRIPGVSFIASKLPSWPRWARIVATVAFAVVVVFLLYLWFTK